MRQLLTRIEDELHAAIRKRAQELGKSVNAYVAEVLSASIGEPDGDAMPRVRAYLAGHGSLVVPEAAPVTDEQRAKALASTSGVGRIASEAVEAGRRER